MTAQRARDWLDRARDPDGALGYLPGEVGRPEPTVLAGAAGLALPLDWLARAALGWVELLLPAVLAGHPADPSAQALQAQALRRLLALEGEPVADDGGQLGFDPAIRAWPWVAGTAPWVEPTAYALISLGRCGRGAHPRVAEGQRMLLDRQCADGGWNYGNPAVLGATLESDPPPTAWACLALPTSAATARGVERLADVLTRPSTLSLALLVLARARHGLEPGPALDALRARQDADGGFGGRCDWTALAACALAVAEGAPHPFRPEPP